MVWLCCGHTINPTYKFCKPNGRAGRRESIALFPRKQVRRYYQEGKVYGGVLTAASNR